MRTAMICGALIAIICAWVTYQLNWIRQRHEERTSIKEGISEEMIYEVDYTTPPEPGLPWSLRVFGETPTYNIIIATGARRNDKTERLQELHSLFPEAKIELFDPDS